MVDDMGGVEAMHSLALVLQTHGDVLKEEALAELPSVLRSAGPLIEFVNEATSIGRWVTVTSGGITESFELRRLDIYELADRFPELHLGW